MSLVVKWVRIAATERALRHDWVPRTIRTQLNRRIRSPRLVRRLKPPPILSFRWGTFLNDVRNALVKDPLPVEVVKELLGRVA